MSVLTLSYLLQYSDSQTVRYARPPAPPSPLPTFPAGLHFNIIVQPGKERGRRAALWCVLKPLCPCTRTRLQSGGFFGELARGTAEALVKWENQLTREPVIQTLGDKRAESPPKDWHWEAKSLDITTAARHQVCALNRDTRIVLSHL